MAIPNSILGQWSHPPAATASVQAHTSIRRVLDAYQWPDGRPRYDVFLQGSYKNNTNLRGDSDVDVVVQLQSELQPIVAALSGEKLLQNPHHQTAHRDWRLFRRRVLRMLRAEYGEEAVTAGRKSIKIAKGNIPANADVVVTVVYKSGLAFYLPEQQRWVVSYPQLHYSNGQSKEEATSNRYKRTIRMFKAARNRLVREKVISDKIAPSYFIECLLYNVPNLRFKNDIGQTYQDLTSWLLSAPLQQFKCQNEVVKLFGPGGEQWDISKAQTFIEALEDLWEEW